jgi:hypothetical protein
VAPADVDPSRRVACRRFRLDPTGRNPRHFTVVFDDLDRGVDALVSCEHHIWANPYHEG